MFKFSLGFLFLLFIISCSKQSVISENEKIITKDPFTNYTIEQGNQFCNNNPFVATSYSELKFVAKFDSTAVYNTIDPGRQNDINKLYGFSDNNAAHHQYSARFGWRWSNNALRLFGYVYNNGERDSKELGTVEIGKINDCAIKISRTAYYFILNGAIDSLPRSSTSVKAEGYKLYPYFGGEEFAPHTIHIFIEEL